MRGIIAILIALMCAGCCGIPSVILGVGYSVWPWEGNGRWPLWVVAAGCTFLWFVICIVGIILAGKRLSRNGEPIETQSDGTDDNDDNS